MLRADQLLVHKGLAVSRAVAKAAIAAGQVSADGQRIRKSSQGISPTAEIAFERPHPYVSRGGLKLAAALDQFALSTADATCLDIGASTGGFTQVLLQRGARRVYAVDVGHGQLHASLRNDPRIVNLENLNARNLTREHVAEPPDIIVVDASFISLRLVLPPALALAKDDARLIALFKPQFEVGPANIGKGGIVRDAGVREQALNACVDWLSREQNWGVIGAMPSPITGGDGNNEYLIAARNGRRS